MGMIKIIIRGPWSGRELFELDTGDLFIKIPYVGAGHYSPEAARLGCDAWTWDWWSELKETGEVS